MTLNWILAWWNLIFVVPFGLAVIYLLAYAASGITFGETDAGGFDGDGEVGHGADAGHDFAADHEVHLDADHDLEAHADVDADADTDGHAAADAGDHDGVESGSIRAALTWLGVGRVPLSILLMVLLLAWGATGFVANQLARDAFAGDWRILIVSLPAALLVSLLVTRLVVRSIDRWLPLDETTARRRHDLLGLTGIAMFDIGERFGMLSVRDDRGELHQIPCRVPTGHEPIPKQSTGVLVAFNARERLYHVIPTKAVGASAALTTAER
jgi:membrane protein implicated in regulation of membrane protease activity